MPIRRSASYEATLVYMDEPQLITLVAQKARFVAMAIPSEEGKCEFIATSVTAKNWRFYLEEVVDLRYLFVYADQHILYKTDLMTLKNGKLTLTPINGDVDESLLPSARFFARNHTEEYDTGYNNASSEAILYVDGEWDMADFGKFYSRYSDVYYFLSSLNEVNNASVSVDLRKGIIDAFSDAAFNSGFNYVYFYDALSDNRKRTNRLSIDKIKYESPGYISVQGEELAFEETQSLIESFVNHRKDIRDIYNSMYKYMSKAGLLRLSGRSFSEDNVYHERLRADANRLAQQMKIRNFSIADSLIGGNSLILAKVAMSMYRRLDDSAKFFAQGRVSFDHLAP